MSAFLRQTTAKRYVADLSVCHAIAKRWQSARSRPAAKNRYKPGGVKVLQFNDRANSALPEYAKTSEAYLSINRDGEMMHLRIYRDHAPILEIDVGHWKHYNKQKGYVHIHDYGRDANGNPCRKTPGRDLSPAEMSKYGKLIEKMKGSLK